MLTVLAIKATNQRGIATFVAILATGELIALMQLLPRMDTDQAKVQLEERDHQQMRQSMPIDSRHQTVNSLQQQPVQQKKQSFLLSVLSTFLWVLAMIMQHLCGTLAVRSI